MTHGPAAPLSHPTTISPARARQALLAICVNFLLYGIAVSSWAPMVPFVKERLQLDEATLGFVLLGMGAGGLFTLPISGLLSHRFGTRNMTLYGAPFVCLFLPMLALAPTAWALAGCLFAFSAALGALSIGMNAQAIEVDKLGQRPVLSRIHGVYSIGALSGSALMSASLRAGVPLLVGAIVIAVCLAVLAFTQRNKLLPNDPPMVSPTGRRFRMPPGRVLTLGFLCAILFMGEGAMLDWSAVFLHGQCGLDPATAGLGFTTYAIAMAISRFLGDMFTHRFGKENALRLGSLTGAFGLGCAILIPSATAAFIGFALVGFGLASTVPVVFAASGRVSSMSSNAALPIVTMIGYSGLLAGPALIGMVAKAIGLKAALGGLALLLVFVASKTRLIRPSI